MSYHAVAIQAVASAVVSLGGSMFNRIGRIGAGETGGGPGRFRPIRRLPWSSARHHVCGGVLGRFRRLRSDRQAVASVRNGRFATACMGVAVLLGEHLGGSAWSALLIDGAVMPFRNRSGSLSLTYLWPLRFQCTRWF